MTPALARSIRPLGDQIIIRTIPMEEKQNGIVIPDSARRPTIKDGQGRDQHHVQAEVIAVGPGKRMKGDPSLVGDLAHALQAAMAGIEVPGIGALLERAEQSYQERYQPMVVAGDRILYHPSVQGFDRRVYGLGEGEYFIIGEHSVLAVIERDGE